MESRKKTIEGIVDDLPIALCVAALPEGELVYANRAYVRLLKARSLAGHPETPGSGGCGAVRTAVSAVVEARRAVELDGVALGHGAAPGEVRVVAYPIFDAFDRMTHVNVALFELPRETARHDRHDLGGLQAHGIQNDRMMSLGTLAASVAHEINNPLSYIFVHAEQIGTALGKLDAIAAELEGPRALELEVWLGKLREHFATMRTGTERIAAITREVRNFSRPDDDSLQVVDLRGVVHSVQQLIGKKLENLARLSLDLGQTTTVRGNRARLVQVVLNLVVNAIQALPRGAPQQHEIGIRTYRAEDRAILEVFDSGVGVPAADRERIFDPFVTTKSNGEGTGLGLFVCRNIVRAYAGTLVVDDRPGGGALFRVSLPLARASEAEPVGPAREASMQVEPSRSRQRTRHVLVIDDDPLVARALCARLLHAGYRASRETDGASGLRRLLADESIDLAFCDVVMMDMSGVEVLAALRAQAPAKVAKMVFMTGSALGEGAQQLELVPGVQLVQKPFDIVKHAERCLAELG